MAKKRFFANHAKSSAMVVSLAIHAVIVVVAILVVVAKVIIPEDPDFQVKKVKRPTMPPKKIQVPVDVKKRKPKPRLRKRIVVNKKTFTDIKMPEISGIKGGLGNMGGDGIGGLGFDLKMDLFGGNKSMGNELIGTFFDLKQTQDGKPIKMSDGSYMAALNGFAKSWDIDRLNGYFKAPMKKYSSVFMIPKISASAAPEAFGVGGIVKPKHWAAYYTGHISPPETGRYRFCGIGDNVLLVRVSGRLVIDASYSKQVGKITKWKSDDENSRKYPLAKERMVIGDWFRLTKGKPSEIEVLLGECPGGHFSCQLLIEQKGGQYKQVPFTYKEESGTRPILPIFKTKEIPAKLVGKMKVNPREATLEGPSFGVIK